MTESHPGTWRDDGAPAVPRPGPLGWLLVVTRGMAILSVLLIGVVLILPLRAGERLLAGPRRPVTGPHVQIVWPFSGPVRIVLFSLQLLSF